MGVQIDLRSLPPRTQIRQPLSVHLQQTDFLDLHGRLWLDTSEKRRKGTKSSYTRTKLLGETFLKAPFLKVHFVRVPVREAIAPPLLAFVLRCT